MALRPPSLNARCISKMVSLFSALRAASGDPPGFPEYPGANLPLMRPLMTWGTVSRLGLASIGLPGSEIEAYLIPESASDTVFHLWWGRSGHFAVGQATRDASPRLTQM